MFEIHDQHVPTSQIEILGTDSTTASRTLITVFQVDFQICVPVI
jgi:hypothetical protein